MENKIIKSDCCEVIADTDSLTREDWLKLRQTGFGGSDAGGCMVVDGESLSKYKAPVTVVDSKIKEVKEIDNKHTRYGNRMEPVLRQWYQEDHPDCVVFESRYVYRSIENPFMLANIDGFIATEKGYRGLEIKTVSEFLRADWKDGNIPDDYYCQCQHYMAVFDFQEWEILGLIGKDYISYTVPRNEIFIQDLISAEKHLWYEFVQKKQYPMLLGMDCENSVIDELHINTVDTVVDLNEEVNDFAVRYNEISLEEKKLKAEKEKLKLLIKDAVGDHKKGKAKYFNISYIRSNRKGFDKKALQDKYPEIYEEFETESFSTSIRVTANKAFKEVMAV